MSPKLYGKPKKHELKDIFDDQLFVITGAVAHPLKMSSDGYEDLCLITGLEIVLI